MLRTHTRKPLRRSRTHNTPFRTLTRNALRRTPVTSVILVVFVAVAAMLASAAASLIVTANAAASSLMDRARTPHFLQMHAGSVDEARITSFAQNHPAVENHDVVPMLNVDGAALQIETTTGTRTLAEGLQDNSFVTQAEDFDLLLDTSGALIDPEPGTVWLPLYYRDLLDLESGQTLAVVGPGAALEPEAQEAAEVAGASGTAGARVELEIAGFLRDSQMNSSFASSKRLLVAEQDLSRISDMLAGSASTEYLIQFRLDDPGAVSAFESDYRAADLESNGPTITWSLFRLVNSLSEGITAAIILLVTALLVGIALLCVRFTLLATLETDYREIGVLRALGMRRRDLRALYSRRYLALATAGAVAGYLASFALAHVLLRRVHLYMGPSGTGALAPLLGAAACALIVGVVALAVRRTVRRLDDVSPVQAIRTGGPEQGHRASRLHGPSINAPGPSTNVQLGLRDLVRRSALFVVPLATYILAVFIIVVPQNLHSTVTRPEFITHMGASVSDMRVDAQGEGSAQHVAALVERLESDPRIAEYATLSTASYTAPNADGGHATVKIESGDLDAFPLTYLQGTAPAGDKEIALSTLLADSLGAGLGDTIDVSPDLGTITVTGIYQDITNGGRTAKMTAPHTSHQLMWHTINANVTDGTNPGGVVAEYARDFPTLKVSSVSEFVGVTLGGTIDALRGSAIVALAVGIGVAVLVTALFMRMLVEKDSRPIAVMRAIGFRDRHIRVQYVTRSVVLLVIGVLAGTALAWALGGPMAGVMLSGIGLSHLHLVANPYLAYLASPLALLLIVVGATWLTARPSSASIADHLTE